LGSSALRGRCVLVTGGAGFVGSHVVDAVLGRGAAEVRVFDNFHRGSKGNLASAERSGKLVVIDGDIRDGRAVQTAAAGANVVFHQAALRLPLCEAEPMLAREVMIEGSLNVLRASVDARVAKLVFASSAAVYGRVATVPTPEECDFGPGQGVYGAAKARIEEALVELRETRGLSFVVLRYFNVYGPRVARIGPYREVLARWLHELDCGRAPSVYGDGRQTSDFVYVDDVARANVLAAESRLSSDAINVGTGTETSIAELARGVAEAAERSVDPKFVGAPSADGPVRRCADIRKAQRLLGFAERVRLRDGLRRTASWWSGAERVAPDATAQG
jgi:UDP-glucose 4-epimerase